jgi:hypothetical protein
MEKNIKKLEEIVNQVKKEPAPEQTTEQKIYISYLDYLY